MRRWLRRLLGLEEPQETRFFLVIAAWGLGAGLVYWFVSYEVAGTVLLLALGLACGLIALRLILLRRSGEVRRRAEAEAHGEMPLPGIETQDLPGGGTGGIDRPLDVPLIFLPDPTLAPFAVALGVSLILTGTIYGVAPVAVGIIPFVWGGLTWVWAARDEGWTIAALDARLRRGGPADQRSDRGADRIDELARPGAARVRPTAAARHDGSREPRRR